MLRVCRKTLSVLLALCLICAGTVSVSANDFDTGATFTISVVHTNDIHGNLLADDENQVLGLARVKTFTERQKKKADLVYLLDAGDFFHGQSFATIDEGASAADLMGACGYNAMTVGNHDWNYGKDRLTELEKRVKKEEFMFSMLAGNVINPLENRTFFNSSTYTTSLERADGKIKVAIFGVFDPRLINATAPENVEGLWFEDMQAYAQERADSLKRQSYHIVICLAHCIDPVTLASSVDNVDLWVAGHDHKQIAQTVKTPNGGSAYVVENGSNLNTIGNVEIQCTLDADGNVASLTMQENTVSYDEGFYIPEYPDIIKQIEKIKETQAPLLERMVGSSPEDLNGTWEDVRTTETNLARAITNGYLLETGADVAMENAGGIRASIPKGDVTYGDVLNVSPFGNYVVTVPLSGVELLSMMERSLEIMHQNQIANDSGEYDAWPDNSGNMLQIAGMQVTYDMSKEAGKRILSATVQGQKVIEDMQYTVAMNSFLATDTKDYPELTGKSTLHEYGACEELLAAYFSQGSETILADLHKKNLVAYQAEESDTNGQENSEASTQPENTSQPQTEPLKSETKADTTVFAEIVNEIPKTGTDKYYAIPVVAIFTLTVTGLFMKRKLRKRTS